MTDMTDRHGAEAAEPMSRRRILGRLGLAAAAAYAAPVALNIGQARASSFSSYSGRRGGRRRRSYS